MKKLLAVFLSLGLIFVFILSAITLFRPLQVKSTNTIALNTEQQKLRSQFQQENTPPVIIRSDRGPIGVWEDGTIEFLKLDKSGKPFLTKSQKYMIALHRLIPTPKWMFWSEQKSVTFFTGVKTYILLLAGFALGLVLALVMTGYNSRATKISGVVIWFSLLVFTLSYGPHVMPVSLLLSTLVLYPYLSLISYLWQEAKPVKPA